MELDVRGGEVDFLLEVRMVRILCVLAMCVAALMAQAPAGKQAKGKAAEKAKVAPVPEWRRSAEIFEKEIRDYWFAETKKPDGEFPAVSFNYMGKGGPVPMTFKVMQAYSGEVEWEGTFKGIEKDASLAGRPNKVKVDLPGLGMHVYPAADVVVKWAQLPAETKVTFRGTIEGIAAYMALGGMAPIISIKDAVPLP